VRHPVARTRKTLISTLLLPVLAVAAATVLASAGPAAAGTGYGQLIVDPGTAAPGQTVSILGVCPTNGSTLTGVRSTAFVGGAASITIGSENFTGKAEISGSIAPGSYAVTAECGAGSPSVNITVSAGGVKKTTPPPSTQPPRSTPAAPPPSHTTAPPTTAAPTRTGSAGGMSGSATPSGSMTPTSGMSSPAASGMGGVAGTTSQAPAVTSTGVIRVGLAGHSSPLSGMLPPVLVAAAFVLACATGFLLRRRRRNASGTHE
jgi:hypothetical protein